GDHVVAAQGALLGVLKTLPHEIEGLACSHLDVPGEPTPGIARAVVNEALSAAGPLEVALRLDQRYVGRLAPLRLQPNHEAVAALKPGGIVVLTGGLGGIGQEIARHLLTRLQARVVLVGRAPEAALSEDRL